MDLLIYLFIYKCRYMYMPPGTRPLTSHAGPSSRVDCGAKHELPAQRGNKRNWHASTPFRPPASREPPGSPELLS